MIEVTILGCGSSMGVPILTCECEVCTSKDPYNKRMRCSLLVQNENTTVLVDCGFDIKTQLLASNVKNLDGVIITHCHADHIMGIDHLRAFAHKTGSPVNVYVDPTTFVMCALTFGYLINNGTIKLHKIDYYDNFKIGNIDFQVFRQYHAEIDSLGIRIKDFVYANDVIRLPEDSKKHLQGINTLVIDCISYESTRVHSGLDTVLKWCEEYSPNQVFLTNMGHEVDYHEIKKQTPDHINPCYDGMKITIG